MDKILLRIFKLNMNKIQLKRTRIDCTEDLTKNIFKITLIPGHLKVNTLIWVYSVNLN